METPHHSQLGSVVWGRLKKKQTIDNKRRYQQRRRSMMYGRKIIIIGLIGFLVLIQTVENVKAQGPPQFPPISLILKYSGLVSPLLVTNAADGSNRIFIVEQAGRIRIVQNDVLLATPLLDISSTGADRVLAGGEQGLLGLAFPPGFALKNYFYVNYTRKPDGATVVARYFITANPNIANPASEEIILIVPQPFANHNGGQLAFSPIDGFLYIGMGDGGSGCDPFNNAQNPGSLLGKMLRIDVESGIAPYAVPPTNPFVNTPGFRPEIWALGLRNPFRFSFDRLTGDFFIGDVGQNAFEEIDFQPFTSIGGENYGWNILEGFHFSFNSSGCSPACLQTSSCSQAGFVPPVAEYDHGLGCAVIGGFVYRGNLHPRMQGVYFYGDLCTGNIWGLRRNGTAFESSILLTLPLSISSFGEDEAGEIYIVDIAAGDIYKITVRASTDFAATGKADIFWRQALTGQLFFWLMDGVALVDQSSLGFVKDQTWEIQGVGDFSGDGKADFLWRNKVSGQVFTWLMNGADLNGQGSPGGVSDLNWEIKGVSDFNGDGKADILWWNKVTGQVFIWLMNGTTPISEDSPGTVSDLIWQIEGVGDFNGDGKADILWRNKVTGQVYIWLMNGTTPISEDSPGIVSDLNWKIEGAGDFNGDGKADILWRNKVTGQVFIWLMNGEAIAEQGSPATIGDLNWQIEGVNDFNGDGKADILWRHAISGQVFIWLMDGIVLASQGSPATISDLGWRILTP